MSLEIKYTEQEAKERLKEFMFNELSQDDKTKLIKYFTYDQENSKSEFSLGIVITAELRNQ